MKTIQSEAGTFGPFRMVVPLDDRLRCDGVDYQFDILGDHELIQGMPEPLPPPRVIPPSIPMLNARIVMSRAGWLVPWEELLDGMEGQEGDEARIKWASALTVRWDDPLVVFAIAALGKTEEEAGDLFIAAATLNP